MQPPSSIRLLITSGNGPVECREAVLHATKRIEQEAHDLSLEVLCELAEVRNRDFPGSAIVSLTGPKAKMLAERWVGTVKWTCKSRHRSGHKRQNWFIGIFQLEENDCEPEDLRSEDLSYQSFRAGGPGGQHQNKTDSAVRLTHVPTGLSVVAKDERSQFRNKQLAYERLREKMSLKQTLAEAIGRRQKNQLHHQLERGNPVRWFQGPYFKEK